MQKKLESIFILDDHPLILKGLKEVCEKIDSKLKIKTFETPDKLIEAANAESVDLFLIDLQLKNEDGREVIKMVREKCPTSKIVAISSFETARIIKSSYQAGADAYIIKNIETQELVNGLKSIWLGERAIQKEVEHALKESKLNKTSRSLSIPEVTKREKEVLQLIAKEKTTAEIATILFLSEKTIETHRSNLILKFGVKNSVGLIKKAMELELLS